MHGRNAVSPPGLAPLNTRRPVRWAGPLAAVTLLLAACAGPGPDRPGDRPDLEARLAALGAADAWLIGEQHDAPEHQAMHAQAVRHLARSGRLAALAIEMAESGRDTAGLHPDADEPSIRAALAWQDSAWPWAAYGPAIVAAVRAGVPVVGANLPRARMADALRNEALDAAVPPAALARLRVQVRDGHCGLLPEARIPAMTRIQIARDQTMARTVAERVRPGATVLLVAGSQHVRRSQGVPLHLPPGLATRVLLAQAGGEATPDPTDPAEPSDLLRGDVLLRTPAIPAGDPCAGLRQHLDGGTGQGPGGPAR